MPVDPNDVHSEKRHPNPLYIKARAQQRSRRWAERRGAVTLSSVPSERSVGDAFRLMLEACEIQNLFCEDAFTPLTMRDLEAAVREYDKATAEATQVPTPPHHDRDGDNHVLKGERVPPAEQFNAEKSSSGDVPTEWPTSPLYSLAFHPSPFSPSGATTGVSAGETDHALTVREVDEMWSLLDRTPLNAPVHGALALRGNALVRTVLLELVYSAYPRLRSKHVQQLLHETTGLLPCGRAAIRLGFAEHSGVESDIAMWRELNMLGERLRIARKEATAHLQRMEKGVAAQRRWYWRAVLRSVTGRIKLFPVQRTDLQPRLEWVRSSLFAFVAFVEMAETSGDTRARVRPLILHLFGSSLARHVRRRQVMEAAALIVAEAPASSDCDDLEVDAVTHSGSFSAMKGQRHHRVAQLLARVKSMTADEEEVMEGRIHPMNYRADRRREQFESSGGAHGTQMLRDEALERHEVEYGHLAPPMLLHALEAVTSNAFKEMQLILRYAPQVSEQLRWAPIDVDQTVRRVIDVQETNNYASLHHGQQFRQVEHTACRVFAGSHCLGEGKGETLMAAMQDASLQMLFRYYLRPPTAATPFPESSPPMEANAERTTENVVDFHNIPAPRIRPPKTEEEVAL